MTDAPTGKIGAVTTGNGCEDDAKRIQVSYLTLRRAIGCMGVLLPVVLAGGCVLIRRCCGLQETISHYYATEMRDVFVGTLFTIGWFLFSYRGYDPKDNIAGTAACFCAMGVALFDGTSENAYVYWAHIACAAGLFLILAYFSICLFTKTHSSNGPTAKKKWRNRIYVGCGTVMLVCLALVALEDLLVLSAWFPIKPPVFWLETLMLWAFGFSWLVKGETLLKDE